MAGSERTEAGTSTATDAGTSTATEAGTETRPRAGQEGRQSSGTDAIAISGPVADATPLEKITISCLANAHYHSSREAFLDTMHRWFMFFVIVLGAAALTDALPKLIEIIFGVKSDPALFKEACAALVAIIAALDLTFDLSNRARSHAMMKRRYYELLASVREGHRTPDEARVCLDEFSAHEEPPYRVLYLACWNAAQQTVFGRRAMRFEISFLGNLFKNWWRRPTANYPVVGGA